MPNHITNILTAYGDGKEIQAMFAAVYGGADEYGNVDHMDFNKILPMPEELNIEAGSRTDRALSMYKDFLKESSFLSYNALIQGKEQSAESPEVIALLAKYEDLTKDDPDLMNLGKQCFENIAIHGAPTWYEWAIENWGTKWNAYSSKKIDESSISFQTAWAGVPQMIGKLSEMYPDLRFEYEFADEDWGYNVGQYEFKDGECVMENLPDGGSPEAEEIAARLLGELEAEDDEELEE